MSGAAAVTSDLVRDFVETRRLALAGASRSGKKFGNVILRELVARGYEVVPVHPEAPQLEGVRCARDLEAAAGRVDGLVVVTPPAQAVKLVGEAAAAGIRRVWLQQGAGSAEAVRIAGERGVSLVHGQCLLMFLPGIGGLHRFHRGLWRLLGRLPAEAARA
ncbi:MAG: CoA-binding protein [Thermoanaerobaculia bacterium]|nr:CoA-binding protein [Thermoanaerobaculia bacterium]